MTKSIVICSTIGLICLAFYARSSLASTNDIVIDEDDEESYHSHSNYAKYFYSSNRSDYTPGLAEQEWHRMFRSLDRDISQITKSASKFLGQNDIWLEMEQHLEPKCRDSLRFMRQSMMEHKLWAMRMFDANGRMPAGLVYGKLSAPGDWEQCVRIRVNDHAAKEKFRGNYCLLDFRLPVPPRPLTHAMGLHTPLVNLSATSIGKKYPIVSNYSGMAAVFHEVGVMFGVCLPSTCTGPNVAKAVGKVVEGLHLIVSAPVDCQLDAESIWDRVRFATVLSILFFFILTILVSGSTYLYYRHRQARTSTEDPKSAPKSHHHQSMASVIVQCFAIQPNFERLTKPDPHSLTFVHYTRVVAMALTVITHTGALGTLQAITKPADATGAGQMFRDFLPQMMANSFTSIQVFFFMAGLMLVLSTYPAMIRNKGHLSLIEYAIKRALRLWPGMITAIALNFIWPLFADGPMITYGEKLVVSTCESNWWRTLGFISNFDHVDRMCLRHSYFTAADYQLHLLSFPILIVLYKRPRFGLSMAGALIFIGFLAQNIMASTKTVLPFMSLDFMDKDVLLNVIHHVHHATWNHFASFFSGFIIGYLVVKRIRLNISQSTVFKIWIVVMPIGLGAIFAPYYWNHYKRPFDTSNSVAYLILDRLALLVMCSWLSYGSMVMGQPPPRKRRDDTRPSAPSVKPSAPSDPNDQSELSLAQKRPTNFSASDTNLTTAGKTNVDESQAYQSKTNNQLEINNTGLHSSRSIGSNLNVMGDSSAKPTSVSLRVAASNPQAPTHESKDDKPKKSPQKRVSAGINTLCLVLSRLTFQLYLLNMVVLWFDVSHSNYLWYLGYYFIFTKTFAIYTMTTILSIIFFVGFESPCLSMYVFWVKSRAQRRAQRNAELEAIAKKLQEQQQMAARNIPMMYIDGGDDRRII